MSDEQGTGGGSGSPPAKGPWAGPINGILYGLIFQRQLDESLADAMARAMLQRRSWGNDPNEFVEAIPQALAWPGRLVDALDTPHTEEQFRAYLVLLAERLEALRPWPS
jgi:hypothetical protein